MQLKMVKPELSVRSAVGRQTSLRTQPSPAAYAAGHGIRAGLLHLQQTHGNRFVQRMLSGSTLQRKCGCGGSSAGACTECNNRTTSQGKLNFSQPGDEVEREADNIADRVLAKRNDNRSTESNSEEMMSDAVRGWLQSKGSGQPLDREILGEMESRFGESFTGVRLHTDARAADTANRINARAFTFGQDIAFAPNAYSLGTTGGKMLLAHELVHTVQQRGLNRGRELLCPPSLRRAIHQFPQQRAAME